MTQPRSTLVSLDATPWSSHFHLVLHVDVDRVQQYCLSRQQAYLRGIASARELYPQAA